MRGAQLIIQIVLARSLIPEDFAQFFFYWTMIVGLSAFIGESFGITISRQIAVLSPEKRSGAIQNGIVLGLLAACIPFVLIAGKLILFPSGTVESVNPFYIAAVGSVFSFQSTIQNILIGTGQIKRLSISQFLIFIVLIVVVFATSKNFHWTTILTSLVLVHALNCFTLLILSILEASGDFKFSKLNFELDQYWKPVTTASLTLALSAALGAPIHVICISFLRALDAELLTTHVGTFGVGFILYSLCSFLPGTATFLLTPRLSKDRSQDRLRKYLRLIDRYLVAAVFGLILLAVLVPFIPLSLLNFATEYRTPMGILALAGTFAGASSLLATGLNANFQTNLTLFNMIIHSGFYLIFAVIFVVFGRLGANGLACALLMASVAHYISSRISFSKSLK